MLTELRRGVSFTVVTMLLFGGGYHLSLWAVGRVAFPSQVEGSLIRRADGTVVGSRLIAQAFSGPQYFHPRPSAVDYDAASTGGSNLGPSNPEHLATVQERIAAITTRESVPSGQVPSEMVTASGGGLEPHISPAAAELQARRVGSARGIPIERMHEQIEMHTQSPTFGFLGRARVNVLELNLALDSAFGPPSSKQ